MVSLCNSAGCRHHPVPANHHVTVKPDRDIGQHRVAASLEGRLLEVQVSNQEAHNVFVRFRFRFRFGEARSNAT
jgi:hypothetical protein